MDIRI